MKKQKLKLGLQKMSVSNLQNLYTVKGGQGSVQLCSENDDCGTSTACNTQNGGFECGLTMATNCTIENTIHPPCITDACTTFYTEPGCPVTG